LNTSVLQVDMKGAVTVLDVHALDFDADCTAAIDDLHG